MRPWLVLFVPLLLGSSSTPGPTPHPLEVKKFRFVLHVPEQSGIYATAWSDDAGKSQDVITDHDGADGKTVVYKRRIIWIDRCTWDASETIKPTSADHYTYEYREAPVSCPPGVHADLGATTPRDGEITVVPLGKDAPLTPLFAWAKGWDKPR